MLINVQTFMRNSMEATKPPGRPNAAKAKRVSDELLEAVAAPRFRPNRKAEAAMAELMVPGGKRPKLVITCRSTMNGRGASLIRIRPSIWKRLEAVESVGTRQYLVIEAAMIMFIAHLEGLEPGKTLILDAEKMAPTAEAHELLEATDREVKSIPRKRVAKTNWGDPEENARPLSK